MKFKVGDKVRVTEAVTDHRKHHIGKIYTVNNINARGLSFYSRKDVNYYNIKEEECYFIFYEDELELVTAVNFTKADLKDGMVVEYADGRRRMCLNDKIMGDNCYIPLIDFNDDLSNNKDNNNDIVKVYNSSAYILNDYWKDKYLTLIWERPKDESVKEMTVEEIEKELGYKVKIVAD